MIGLESNIDKTDAEWRSEPFLPVTAVIDLLSHPGRASEQLVLGGGLHQDRLGNIQQVLEAGSARFCFWGPGQTRARTEEQGTSAAHQKG